MISKIRIQLLEVKYGAAVQSLNQENLKNIKIPIPPLPEQKRIVEILDEAFEAIDQAKANVERNIQNAEELFQSKLNEIFSQRGDGWEENDLNQVMMRIWIG
ncbi:MAG: restriction endonuclease subunit S [Gracilimonas sp.]|nr:restriction endonuclease subunit S [Gracilimonas sp.]